MINGALAYAGAMLALLTSLDPSASIHDIGEIPRYIAIGTGVVTALKDTQAALANFGD